MIMQAKNPKALYIMKTYKAIKKTLNSNTIVEELNAKVYTSTFPTKTGKHLADVYTYDGTQCKNLKEIVFHQSCAPIGTKFIETIILSFN